nr:condensin complex subunit 2 [Ipomoea batatas]
MAETLSPNPKLRAPFSPTSPFFLGSNDDNIERAQARAARAAAIRRKPVVAAPPPAASSCLDKKQIFELFQNCIKLASENKINQKNTWELGLIDHLRDIIKAEEENDAETNFQKVCLDLYEYSCAGNAKIAKRVDLLFHFNESLESVSEKGIRILLCMLLAAIAIFLHLSSDRPTIVRPTGFVSIGTHGFDPSRPVFVFLKLSERTFLHGGRPKLKALKANLEEMENLSHKQELQQKIHVELRPRTSGDSGTVTSGEHCRRSPKHRIVSLTASLGARENSAQCIIAVYAISVLARADKP